MKNETKTVSELITEVKRAKASNAFQDSIRVYGGVRQALRAHDSISIEEAVFTLSICQPVSVSKLNGKVIVQ